MFNRTTLLSLIKNICIKRYKLLINIILLFLLPILPITINAASGNENNYNQSGNFELGAGFGTPSGLNTRYWFTNKLGFDSAMGASPEKNFAFSFDLLWEEFQLFKTSTIGSNFFFGLGTMFEKDESSFKKNIRIPLGISVPLYRYPLNFSFYIAPAAVISGKKDFEMNWGIGVRYNFTMAAATERRQESLEREVNRLGENVNTLQEGLNTTKGKLAATEGELSATKGKLSETEQILSNTTGKLNELTGTLGTIKNKLDITEGELGTTRTKLQSTTQELDTTKNQLDYVQGELRTTKKTLDDRQVELNKKQVELDQSKVIIANAFSGKEKKEEEGKVDVRQKELDEQVVQLSKQKKEWEKVKQSESLRREQLNKKCQERGGIIDEDGYCNCPENQEWDFKTDKCVCSKGYYRNSPAEECKPCEVIKENGNCSDGDCYENEEKVKLAKGPHKYVCVKKCRNSNEVWSKQKKTCICKDGYYRSESGECVPRQ